MSGERLTYFQRRLLAAVVKSTDLHANPGGVIIFGNETRSMQILVERGFLTVVSWRCVKPTEAGRTALAKESPDV